MKLAVGLLILGLTAVPSGFSQGLANRAAVDYETVRLSKVTTSVRTTEKITLDGRLDEPAGTTRGGSQSS